MRKSHRFLLVSILAAVVATAGFASGRAEARDPLLVSAEQLSARLDDPRTLILDARGFDQYRDGFIPTAVSLPTDSLNQVIVLDDGAEVQRIVQSADEIVYALQDAGINASSRIVIYDQGGSTLAPRLFWILEYYGHTNVAILDGGFAAWSAAGLDTSTEVVDVARGDFVPVAQPHRIADFDYVRSAIGSDSIMLCNALAEASFASAAIPTSTNLPQTNVFATDGVPLLKQADILETLLDDIGFNRDHEIVFYCGAGYAASVDYFVARLIGLERVRMYDGSLIDWRARGGELTPGGEI